MKCPSLHPSPSRRIPRRGFFSKMAALGAATLLTHGAQAQTPAAATPAAAPAQAGSVVTISKDAQGNYGLVVNGKPFHINGAGGTEKYQTLVECGGNSVRTWGIESLSQPVDGKPLIERAQELGLMVTAGIWLGHEKQGFHYADQAAVQRQRDAVRAAVKKWKDSPAILIWGLGNEMEGEPGDDVAVYKEVNTLAGIIKEEDKNHPVMTVIASASPTKVKNIVQYCPNIDILGVNAYSGGGGSGKAAKLAGWTKPFVLTEFGPSGQWEVAKTKWGAPIEQTSWEKAKSYWGTQATLTDDSKDTCLGSYAFLWGHKQEATSTWYGMFLDTGEKMPTVDAMTRVWTGKWPANRSPKIEKFDCALSQATVAPGAAVPAEVTASDAENDTLSYQWEVVPEQTVHGSGGEDEPKLPVLAECIGNQTGPKITVTAPKQPGAYRLFITVRDGKGGASKDNIPFQVQ